MLLPAPLRSLVSSAAQAPLSVLYAEEGDARLAALKAAVRAANVEVNSHRARAMAEPAYAAARATSLTGKAPRIAIPPALKKRCTATQGALVAYQSVAHPPLNLEALVPKLRAVIASIPRSSYTESELKRTHLGVACCVALDRRVDDARLRARASWRPQPPPAPRFAPLPSPPHRSAKRLYSFALAPLE